MEHTFVWIIVRVPSSFRTASGRDVDCCSTLKLVAGRRQVLLCRLVVFDHQVRHPKPLCEAVQTSPSLYAFLNPTRKVIMSSSHVVIGNELSGHPPIELAAERLPGLKGTRSQAVPRALAIQRLIRSLGGH